MLVYLSVGEAEDYRPYWKAAWKKRPPAWLGSSNSAWLRRRHYDDVSLARPQRSLACSNEYGCNGDRILLTRMGSVIALTSYRVCSSF